MIAHPGSRTSDSIDLSEDQLLIHSVYGPALGCATEKNHVVAKKYSGGAPEVAPRSGRLRAHLVHRPTPRHGLDPERCSGCVVGKGDGVLVVPAPVVVQERHALPARTIRRLAQDRGRAATSVARARSVTTWELMTTPAAAPCLPAPITTFLTRALHPGEPSPTPRPDAARRVVLDQRGALRMKPGGPWLDFTATQSSAIRETEFSWRARVRMAPLMTVSVKDGYRAGRGILDARLWGLVPVAHAEGPDVDQGEVQRYLAELPWNPLALAHNPDLRFEARPNGAIRVAAGPAAHHVDLFFDDAGDIVRTFAGNRPFGDQGPTPWEGAFTGYRVLGGLRVPTHGEVRWLLPSGPFLYWRGKITRLLLEG